MLVRIQPGTGSADGLSGAERIVVRMMESWRGEYHLPGLAMFNVNVPDGRGGVRQTDALLWTPSSLAVVEIKGLTRHQHGTLEIPVNGNPRIDGEPAALHTLSGASPVQQLQGGSMR